MNQNIILQISNKLANNQKVIALVTNPNFDVRNFCKDPLAAMNNPDIMELVEEVLNELKMFDILDKEKN
jgi:hypothetical protein